MSNEKDVSEKLLEDYNDVFADIINNALFDGREVVKPEELENAVTISQLKLLDGVHEQERDTAKYWKQGTVIIAAAEKRFSLCCGLSGSDAHGRGVYAAG